MDLSLALHFPNTARQYAADRNDLTVEEVTAGSNRQMVWQCALNGEHTWEDSPDHRTAGYRGSGRLDLALCPFCTNRRLCPSNSLAARYSKLAAEFDREANFPLTPETVIGAKSVKKYVWRCAAGHSFIQRLSHRIAGHGCPDSSCVQVSVSSAHEALRDALEAQGLSVESNVRIETRERPKRGSTWEVDLVLAVERVVIEYDGYFHGHPGRKEVDLRKTRALRADGWRVIRVREAPLRALGDSDVEIERGQIDVAARHVLEVLGESAVGTSDVDEVTLHPSSWH